MARKIRIIRTKPSNAPKPVPLSVIFEGTVQRRFWSRVQRGTPEECWAFSGAPNSEGYGVVNLRIGPYEYKKVKAHVFALMSATGQQNTKCALHSLKCSTKMCCNPDHLRWGDWKENGWDARDVGKVPGQKLSWDEVDEIRRLLGEKYTTVEVSAFFGIDQTTVSNIKLGKQWNPSTRRTAA